MGEQGTFDELVAGENTQGGDSFELVDCSSPRALNLQIPPGTARGIVVNGHPNLILGFYGGAGHSQDLYIGDPHKTLAWSREVFSFEFDKKEQGLQCTPAPPTPVPAPSPACRHIGCKQHTCGCGWVIHQGSCGSDDGTKCWGACCAHGKEQTCRCEWTLKPHACGGKPVNPESPCWLHCCTQSKQQLHCNCSWATAAGCGSRNDGTPCWSQCCSDSRAHPRIDSHELEANYADTSSLYPRAEAGLLHNPFLLTACFACFMAALAVGRFRRQAMQSDELEQSVSTENPEGEEGLLA